MIVGSRRQGNKLLKAATALILYLKIILVVILKFILLRCHSYYFQNKLFELSSTSVSIVVN